MFNKVCESVNLILSVEKQPCIWDSGHADYHDRDAKDFAWDHICREVIDDWDLCEGKINKCAELKKKWTHIRDYYRKKLINTKNLSGTKAKKSKTYIYSQLLKFLTPVLTKKDSEGSYNDDSDCNQIPSDSEEEKFEEHEIIYLESPGPSLKVQKGQKREKFDPKQISGDEDDDTKFLLSFRSYMKSMNHHQKLDFQVGLLKLVKKFTMGDDTS